jgi:hypothetical protein
MLLMSPRWRIDDAQASVSCELWPWYNGYRSGESKWIKESKNLI